MSDRTGHKLELSDATDHMAAALTSGNPDAVRAAMGDHATALNSQATAMAASIAEPVYTRLGALTDQVRALAEIVTNARQADLNWRTEERLTRDAQSTRLYIELDKLIAASEESGRRLGKIEQRLDRKRVEIDEIKRDTDELKREVAELKAWREAQVNGDGT